MSDTEQRYRDIFRTAHAGHPGCIGDEWLMEPCRGPDGREAERALVWSRRNGPWSQHDLLWVGAAPGNAGGMGSGDMGAHATRIPFGGDIAGANLDVLLSSVGLDRNRTFIVASLNQLPERGGGEPRVSELRQPVGHIPSSVHLLRRTLLAAAPRLVVTLGNVALRTTIAAVRLEETPRITLPGLPGLAAAGLQRGELVPWPDALPPDAAFAQEWSRITGRELPGILWLLHPSAQNMSPFAGTETMFHTRMLETRDALRSAVAGLTGEPLPEPRPELRPEPPVDGIYALPEWRESIAPRHTELDRLWREKGV